MGKTLGTAIPLFSMSLIETLIKKLSYRAIWNIVLRHPRRERKIAFITMYFSSLKDRVGPLAYKGFVNGILELEKKNYTSALSYFNKVLSLNSKFFQSSAQILFLKKICL